jgi:hypothetical protein
LAQDQLGINIKTVQNKDKNMDNNHLCVISDDLCHLVMGGVFHERAEVEASITASSSNKPNSANVKVDIGTQITPTVYISATAGTNVDTGDKHGSVNFTYKPNR